MQITDPIADLLTRIRNASTAKHPSVEIPASNMKKAICQILVDEGYIKGMQVKNDTVQGTIVVTLKYQANGEPVIASNKTYHFFDKSYLYKFCTNSKNNTSTNK